MKSSTLQLALFNTWFFCPLAIGLLRHCWKLQNNTRYHQLWYQTWPHVSKVGDVMLNHTKQNYEYDFNIVSWLSHDFDICVLSNYEQEISSKRLSISNNSKRVKTGFKFCVTRALAHVCCIHDTSKKGS